MRTFEKNIALWLVLITVFLNYVSLGLVYPMFSTMLLDTESIFFNFETSLVVKGVYLGVLLGIAPFASFLSGPFLGALSDRKGRRPLFLFCLVLSVIGYVVCVLSVVWKNLFVMILGRFIIGISNGNIGIANASLVDLSSQSNKTKFFGLYSAALGAGFAAGPFFGGVFSKFGFSVPFIVSGLAVFVNFLLVVLFFQETRECALDNRDIKKVHKSIGFKKIINNPSIFFILLIIVIYSAGWSLFYEFLPASWISRYRFDSVKIGFIFAYGAVFYAVFSWILAEVVVNKYSPKKVLFYSLLLIGGVILLTPFLSSSFFIWIYLPFFELLCACVYPAYNTMMSNMVDENAQGEILGASASAQAFAYGVTPFFGGAILGVNINMPVMFSGILMLIAAIMVGKKKI